MTKKGKGKKSKLLSALKSAKRALRLRQPRTALRGATGHATEPGSGQTDGYMKVIGEAGREHRAAEVADVAPPAPQPEPAAPEPPAPTQVEASAPRRGRPRASLELTEVDRRLLEARGTAIQAVLVPLNGTKPATIINGIRARLQHAGMADLEVWWAAADDEHITVSLKSRRARKEATA